MGFSTVISLGPNTAVELPQVLDFLATDASTQSILVYMEGIRHARRFLSALRAAAYAKPVVVMKSGRRPAGTRAALTHSASIVGADEVFDAALRRAGVVRVRAFTQLFSAAKCLASRFRPVGRRLAIVTNGGGPGVLAADWAGEIGLAVADDFKGQGLGSRLMLSIIDFARSKGLAEIVGLILTNNAAMLRLMKSLGFAIAPFPEDPDFRLATKAL